MRRVIISTFSNPQKENDMKSLPELFDEYNERFWGGRLPKYQIKLFKDLLKDGYCLSEDRTIFIREGLDDEKTRRVLLHEMCHHKTPYHGKKFMAQFEHLAEMGETWVIDEIELYKNSPTWNQIMGDLRNDLSDWAFSVDESVTFSDVLKALARDLGLTPDELLKKAPWAETAWIKERKQSALFRERKRP
jgi:hypothetical protein